MTGVVPLHQPSLDRRERTRLGRGQVPRTAGKATTGRATQVTGRAAGPGIGQVQRTAGASGLATRATARRGRDASERNSRTGTHHGFTYEREL